MIYISNYTDIRQLGYHELRATKYIKAPKKLTSDEEGTPLWTWSRPRPLVSCQSGSFQSEHHTGGGRMSTGYKYTKSHYLKVCMPKEFKKVVFISHNVDDGDRYYRVYEPDYKDHIIKLAKKINSKGNSYVLFQRVNSADEVFSIIYRLLIFLIMFIALIAHAYLFTDYKIPREE